MMQIESSLYKVIAAVAMLSGGMLPTREAAAQIQYTTSCPAGYWDTLSVMMMDPGLAANYHMEGTNGYMYTNWRPDLQKVNLIKGPAGYPWDINLYDSSCAISSQGCIYQWVTEEGPPFNDPPPGNGPQYCKKFNNGSDYSFPWMARCAVPGGDGTTSSVFWNPAPPAQPYNSQYYHLQSGGALNPSFANNPEALGSTLMELKPTGTIGLYWSDGSQFTATTMPLQYTYSCDTQGDVDSCNFREVFEYAVGQGPDNVQHSFGLVHWRYYINANYHKGLPADWGDGMSGPGHSGVPANESWMDHMVQGTASINFQCF